MNSETSLVAVTGAGGFIGRNLVVRLREQGFPVRGIKRDTPDEEARRALMEAAVIFHLAGANRPESDDYFLRDNRDYTAWVARAIEDGGRRPLVIYSSTVKVSEDSLYGRSKLEGEAILDELSDRGAATVAIFRLPNVFGKWARPNYNSAVATFCHNSARGLPLRIDDPEAPMSLLYVDDLIDQWIGLIGDPPRHSGLFEARGVHRTTVGEVAELLRGFAGRRKQGLVDEVGAGLPRALYATFISSLPEDSFSYAAEPHGDDRGTFTEVVKTRSSGQVSCMTAHPGITRGGHYHHSKVEKFLVVQGRARFRFRHIETGTQHELLASADRPIIVETIPGWAHDVTNVGDDELIAIIWANEVFDPGRPDTIAHPL